MLTIKMINVGASNRDGISDSIWTGCHEATNDSIPLQPVAGSDAVAIMETIVITRVIPYPMLQSVARIADPNPNRLTAIGRDLVLSLDTCSCPCLKNAW